MLRILSITVRRMIDDAPDLSYLGEYSDSPEAVHVDRKERGDMGRSEFRYFNAGCGDPDYIEQDYETAEAYNTGDWCMLGIAATAQIVVGDHVQRITSGGLWGVQSDSDESYLQSVEREELADLARQLALLGIPKRQITRAIAAHETQAAY